MLNEEQKKQRDAMLAVAKDAAMDARRMNEYMRSWIAHNENAIRALEGGDIAMAMRDTEKANEESKRIMSSVHMLHARLQHMSVVGGDVYLGVVQHVNRENMRRDIGSLDDEELSRLRETHTCDDPSCEVSSIIEEEVMRRGVH